MALPLDALHQSVGYLGMERPAPQPRLRRSLDVGGSGRLGPRIGGQLDAEHLADHDAALFGPAALGHHSPRDWQRVGLRVQRMARPHSQPRLTAAGGPRFRRAVDVAWHLRRPRPNPLRRLVRAVHHRPHQLGVPRHSVGSSRRGRRAAPSVLHHRYLCAGLLRDRPAGPRSR